MELKKVTKKSKNLLRLRRLRLAMETLNYYDRVIKDFIRPIQERKQELIPSIQEMFLDEGISPDLISKVQGIEVDDEAGEIRYTFKPKEDTPPKPEQTETPAAKKPAAKKPAKKKAAKKKAAKKRTRKR